MKLLYLVFLLFPSVGFCDEVILKSEEVPFLTTQEFKKLKKEQSLTFEIQELSMPYETGRIAPPMEGQFHLPSKEFKKAEDGYPKEFNLSSVGQLSAVKDQKRCGSCVYFSVTSAFEDALILRNLKTQTLSPQYLMSCAQRRNMCGGSYFSLVAQGLVAKGGVALEAEYPYTASNAACRGQNFTLHGKIVGYKLIDNSHLSIIGALKNLNPVLTTIGAGGNMMQYRGGGVMNGCQNIGTNHEMEIVGYNCGSSVDASGNCKFDGRGFLARNAGAYWIIKNSWGTSYGDRGYLLISMYSSQGGRCNNVTEEVGILDIGVEPTPPQPTGKEFFIDNDVVTIKGVVKPNFISFYDNIVRVITEFLLKIKD